ncbi:hypothetical protein N7530_002851 [Penicillium desertorum]|uniref:Uncharacterized protein n=1 Tax=Penicillium desertorum TaxID=1303715 RepID=A0A9W9X4S8_9EURO|nr:hypothetical protein N7530_002851 [Penicillium desertorum]
MINTGVSQPYRAKRDVNDDRGEHHTPDNDDSNGDTEPLSTPEFWANFGDGSSHSTEQFQICTDKFGL